MNAAGEYQWEEMGGIRLIGFVWAFGEYQCKAMGEFSLVGFV
jgi:hypothetical protein